MARGRFVCHVEEKVVVLLRVIDKKRTPDNGKAYTQLLYYWPFGAFFFTVI